MVFSIGLGRTLGVLKFLFFDVGQFFGIFLSFWFWLTLIVHPVSSLPEARQSAMSPNLMARWITAFSVILVNG